MKVAIIPVTPFRQNSSLLICKRTKKGAIVDPGGDLGLIYKAVKDQGVELEKIFLTHGHLDHAGATAQLAKELSLPVEGPHSEDQFLIDKLPQQAMRYGFSNVETFTPTRWLVGSDTVRFGEVELQVRHCPGHTPGHVIYFNAQHRLALVGDVLFAGSVGRSDLPRGDHATLVRSIREELWPLGNDVTFIPGHGPTSTFGHERASNPFVGDHVLSEE
jgi:hydroxyacylglutathione hydrolase